MITATTWVRKQCPYVGETDDGELTVTCPADAPELHQLGERVDGLCKEAITHENFTRGVLALLPEGSGVMTRWQTGRWSVEVREGSAVLHDSINGGK